MKNYIQCQYCVLKERKKKIERKRNKKIAEGVEQATQIIAGGGHVKILRELVGHIHYREKYFI